jgi:hypothetical protein
MNCQVQTYPGCTGKPALAQDEWLELNNKEFSNLPSVQTLEGMSRQGNYIGMTQQCKRFLEIVYSAGSITKRVVYRSGSGAKGNGQWEHSLLWEVMELFLGDCLPIAENTYIQRKLTPGAIAPFANNRQQSFTNQHSRRNLESIKTMMQHVGCSMECITFTTK